MPSLEEHFFAYLFVLLLSSANNGVRTIFGKVCMILRWLFSHTVGRRPSKSQDAKTRVVGKLFGYLDITGDIRHWSWGFWALAQFQPKILNSSLRIAILVANLKRGLRMTKFIYCCQMCTNFLSFSRNLKSTLCDNLVSVLINMTDL